MSKTKFTKEQELKIIDYYNQGNSVSICSSKFGCVETTICNILKRNGFLARKTNSKEREQLICDLYLSGKSTKEIENIIGLKQFSILRYLKKNDIKRRTNGEVHKKYTINENYFEEINTSDKAYFLGLLVSDGYGSSNGFQINLQIGDIDILKTFTEYINYNGTIKIAQDNRKESYKDIAKLIICCQKIGNDLIQYGITKGKSHNAFFPDIPEEFYSHFIRGVFDGDGSIFIKTYKSGTFGICGNKPLLEKIRNVLIEKCSIPIQSVYQPNKDKGFVKLQVTKKDSILKIRDFLYKDCKNLYIARKYNKMFFLK